MLESGRRHAVVLLGNTVGILLVGGALVQRRPAGRPVEPRVAVSGREAVDELRVLGRRKGHVHHSAGGRRGAVVRLHRLLSGGVVVPARTGASVPLGAARPARLVRGDVLGVRLENGRESARSDVAAIFWNFDLHGVVFVSAPAAREEAEHELTRAARRVRRTRVLALTRRDRWRHDWRDGQRLRHARHSVESAVSRPTVRAVRKATPTRRRDH